MSDFERFIGGPGLTGYRRPKAPLVLSDTNPPGHLRKGIAAMEVQHTELLNIMDAAARAGVLETTDSTALKAFRNNVKAGVTQFVRSRCDLALRYEDRFGDEPNKAHTNCFIRMLIWRNFCSVSENFVREIDCILEGREFFQLPDRYLHDSVWSRKFSARLMHHRAMTYGRLIIKCISGSTALSASDRYKAIHGCVHVVWRLGHGFPATYRVNKDLVNMLLEPYHWIMHDSMDVDSKFSMEWLLFLENANILVKLLADHERITEGIYQEYRDRFGQRQAQAAPVEVATFTTPCNSSTLAPDDGECIICCMVYGKERPEDGGIEHPVMTACSHTFGASCLAVWIKNHDTCPLCRQTLFHTTGMNKLLAHFPEIANLGQDVMKVVEDIHEIDDQIDEVLLKSARSRPSRPSAPTPDLVRLVRETERLHGEYREGISKLRAFARIRDNSISEDRTYYLMERATPTIWLSDRDLYTIRSG